ncbi:MAG TPA: diaminopimelate decarboxylase [Candidatus Limnocylindria bacterium]|nr:diaminopimelate decarboxylase [Candidatus Limnocylindria bacterium]
MTANASVGGELHVGGVSVDRAFDALRRLEPGASACYLYDLDQVAERARRFQSAFAELQPLVAYALKANSLPAILRVAREQGLGAEAGSVGELELARAAGVPPGQTILNGNGRTEAEAEWAARAGVHSVNADHIDELDLLQTHAARETAPLRVALRVNPGIPTPGHRYVATGHEDAKFGVSAEDALAAWAARARWPHLRLDGLHLHVGSQLLEPGPIERALEIAFELAVEAAQRGSPLGLVNLGGGFGVDYSSAQAEFPIETHAARLVAEAAGRELEWVLEPGRWLVARSGVLISEVLWVKQRAGRRFVVLAAGMNDLLRPALYHARHRIVAVRPREGAPEPASVVGPVCESADVFDADALLPPLRRGDRVAILDVGAYGASMASNYNGRGRLAELVIAGGALRRARAGEQPADLLERTSDDVLDL